MHGNDVLVQSHSTFLKVVIRQLVDVFAQEFMRVFVIFCLQFDKLQ